MIPTKIKWLRVAVGALIVAILIASPAFPLGTKAIVGEILKHPSVIFSGSNAGILFEKNIANLGHVSAYSKPVTAEFRFHNVTNQLVRVVSAFTSCGCTTSSYDERWVNPGEWGFVKLTYTPQSRPHQRGVFDETAVIDFDGVTVPKPAVIRIAGEVVDDLTIEPTSLDFGNFDLHDQTSRSLRITNSSSSPVNLSLQCAPADVLVPTPNQLVIAPGATETINVVVHAGNDAADVGGALKIHAATGLIDFTIPVVGRPHSLPIFSDRREILFGFVQPGKSSARELWLSSLNGPFEIASIQGDGIPVDATFEKGFAPTHKVKVSATVPADGVPGKVTGQIIATVRSGERTYRVPVTSSAFLTQTEDLH